MTAGEPTYSDSHRSEQHAIAYTQSFADQSYRRLVWHWERAILDAVVVEASQSRPIARYLDFACGTGRILQHLESKVASAYGLDISPEMLGGAREAVQATLVEGDLTAGPVDGIDGSFELITSFRFFLNAEPELRVAAMKGLAELLAPDGVLVFNNHLNRRSVRGLVTRGYTLLRHRDKDRYATMSQADACRLAAAAGLRIDRVHSFGIWPTSHSERTRLPISVITKAEEFLAAMPWLPRWGAYEVYVCRRRD